MLSYLYSTVTGISGVDTGKNARNDDDIDVDVYGDTYIRDSTSAISAGASASASSAEDASAASAASSVIGAMDTKAMPTRVGENDHPEFTWNTDTRTLADLRERFVQLFFQIVRPGKSSRLSTLRKFGAMYSSLLKECIALPKSAESEKLLRLLRAFPTHTRDCVDGKGERDIAYALMLSRYEVTCDVEEVFATIQCWTGAKDLKTEKAPPGSWKDVPNLCNFLNEWYGTDKGKGHILQQVFQRALTEQLLRDDKAYSREEYSKMSLAAKWAPRESSKKNCWLFRRMAKQWFPVDGTATQTEESSFRKFRKVLASMNKALNTLEIHQCGKTWKDIEPKTVPSVALQKQKTALLNERRRGGRTLPDSSTDEDRSSMRHDDADRIVCAEKFKAYAEAAARGDTTVKAKRTSLYDLVRDAIACIDKDDSSANSTLLGMLETLRGTRIIPRTRLSGTEQRMVEAQWRDNGEQVRPGLPPMIPMVDTSGSMTIDKCNPLLYAIGLGLRASEKTHPAFRHRIMTFSDNPAWLALKNPESDKEGGSFVNRVKDILSGPVGYNTNFYKALQLLLDTMVENKVPPEDAKGLVLAVFSDMQIDVAASNGTPQAMHERIGLMYAEKGYEAPHILYWNLRTTEGFPCATTAKNVTMLSGFSPVLLNVLEEKGIEALSEYTPFRMVSEMLDAERFLP